ncbi:type II secretion system protein [Colwellia hornerae]|uniref:Type II secretion system protein n=1 Tax=Colwellia hornerae TaxID=89402 RepID=A0A5C6Q799_9GAMM|nr:type II secretion system protein [Colwellia hornerae]TWX49195.1 type II secretion system protein [Colwellia hornerae]TWX55622.1 type II secretion system protein [Colwellia hornerae]TWX64638.1 type II secretion system protein [Colwellia hornerae]
MKALQKQAGFTLIELVIVIVILGILAATAAPKFIDLTGDARSSVVEAVKGSLNSAADLAHSKALVKGVSDGDISIANQNITFVNAWPDNDSIGLLLTYDVADISASAGTFQHKDASTGTTCQATYNNNTSTSEDRPIIGSVVTDCN